MKKHGSIFICGPSKCECDSNGPGVLLLDIDPYEVPDTEDNYKLFEGHINGGSVTCSKCGMSAFSQAWWE